ncbi:stage II sporulation protein P [Evansella cellulosilytica]|uniref:Stage II sporulation protein P n=1 Tax=Evansella cellulosilytica (strain ATCC 21833 / DSM 2522 / FERM P-1141 / JCM 9156 / N-4) TaxID=649639 RepID=E6TZS9_EVAC2|nr:stage II sporulation protein P [Evansella cellulosilytica]ADU31385.1 stage II sporulation protein P [Evansella cellulosilytica DSM 2522]
MGSKDDKDIIDSLRRNKDSILIRKGFEKELEENLVHRFTRKNKNKLLVPGIVTIVASIVFFLLVISSDNVFEEQQTLTNTEEPLVYIYHTHTHESFFPELDWKDDNALATAYDKTVNVTLLGKHLGETLESKGIPVLWDDTDYTKMLEEQNLEYTESYNVARENINTVLNNHHSIKMLLDIHRDSLPRNITTTTINDEEVAKIGFIVSENHFNYEKNAEFAKQLHELLEERYPELSRGVLLLASTDRNYNQDLHDKSILIDIGGVYNTLEEVKQSAEYLAEIISEILNDNN